MTRSGWAVKLPSRFQVNFVSFPDGSATCQGGSCKARDEGYRGESREQESCEAGKNRARGNRVTCTIYARTACMIVFVYNIYCL